MKNKVKISGLLITYNEEEFIDDFIIALDFVDELIIIDSYSTDSTVEKIKKYPHVRLIQRPFKNFTDQKSFALKQATHNWVLFLDADERIPEALKNEILSTINSEESTASAYFFYRTFMFKNKVLHFSGWQTDKNYRLFKKDKVAFTQDRIVHETLVVDGVSATLQNKLIHYSYKTYEDYKGKMIRYGELKAQEEYQKGKRWSLAQQLLRPAWKFMNHYLLRCGILDGSKGLIICYLNALGVYARYKKLKQLDSL
ncbi:glycosyltransferase family 2 protein [Arenibacter sp. GZD96]|uniref:glycosyltransferase family 2 protein n=1 Tax=Aurantibrevibacter litoralis TaxID=3106030 RepID=UPI002AFF3A8B|nr:glycosyltransferase family 2 protein [Arenibacter sp. GZD-96]MEA1787124.1 glycosyltransferase family 2 protein [Arenibacter sp. GZD-96]